MTNEEVQEVAAAEAQPAAESSAKSMLELLSSQVPPTPAEPVPAPPATAAYQPSTPILAGQAIPSVMVEMVTLPFGRKMQVTIEVQSARYKNLEGGVVTQKDTKTPAAVSTIIWRDAREVPHQLDPNREWQDPLALQVKNQALEQQVAQLQKQLELLKTPNIEEMLTAFKAASTVTPGKPAPKSDASVKVARRLYEVAKIMGVSTRELIDKLNEQGVEVSSHMEILPPDVVESLLKKENDDGG